jgi:hypothetical protein
MIRLVSTPRRSLWRRFLELIEGALPMPPDQRAAHDDDGKDHSPYRKRRLRLHLLEKRGKGGFR